jgi:transglutaminase-like putative cysteine protease
MNFVDRRGVLRAAAALALPGFARIAPRRRTIEMRYEAEVPGGVHSPVSLWLPVPQSDENQTISGLRFSGAQRHEVRAGADGNCYFFAKVPSQTIVRMEFRATRTERTTNFQARQSLAVTECCLGPDRLVPIDGRIREWAWQVVRQAKARTDLERARAIYEHVVSTVKYDKSGKGWGRGDIYYACDARRGNCSDFHAIFIGYARAVGIPAKFAIGLPLPRERGAGQIAGYHCWAEFFTQEMGWVPIDASEAAKDPSRRTFFFVALDENRVEFTKGRDLVLAPKQAGEPLNYFVYPYAEADGRAIVSLRSRFAYRDLA